ncbi:MAG TPA: VOC family protein [Flavipsychrobacter sp.]|nr:VOC family protein [Flavipsychrobacter sp.]
MSTPFLGLRTLGYMVSDITAAKNWYRDVLGIEPYFDQPFYVGFNVAGYELGLAHTENLEPAAGNAITYWGVENVQETYEMLLSKGATEYEKPTDVGEGIIVAGVKDPWGNLFGVIYNPHFQLP